MRQGRILRKNEVARRSGGFPVIGKLSIGGKDISKKTGNEYPVSYDYFVAKGEYASTFTSEYGDKPSRIQVIFPFDDVMKVCREEVDGRGTKDGRRYGYSYDGVTYYLWDEKEKDYLPISIEEQEEQFEKFTKQHKVK